MDMGRRYSPPLPAETTSGSRAEAPLGGGAEVSEQARVSFRTLSLLLCVSTQSVAGRRMLSYVPSVCLSEFPMKLHKCVRSDFSRKRLYWYQ